MGSLRKALGAHDHTLPPGACLSPGCLCNRVPAEVFVTGTEIVRLHQDIPSGVSTWELFEVPEPSYMYALDGTPALQDSLLTRTFYSFTLAIGERDCARVWIEKDTDLKWMHLSSHKLFFFQDLESWEGRACLKEFELPRELTLAPRIVQDGEMRFYPSNGLESFLRWRPKSHWVKKTITLSKGLSLPLYVPA